MLAMEAAACRTRPTPFSPAGDPTPHYKSVQIVDSQVYITILTQGMNPQNGS